VNAEQRSARARLAAHSRWARPRARVEAADASRAAMWRRFAAQVDPDGTLDPDARDRAARSAAKAYAAKMNLARLRRSGGGS
jgi:hypothetical protein